MFPCFCCNPDPPLPSPIKSRHLSRGCNIRRNLYLRLSHCLQPWRCLGRNTVLIKANEEKLPLIYCAAVRHTKRRELILRSIHQKGLCSLHLQLDVWCVILNVKISITAKLLSCWHGISFSKDLQKLSFLRLYGKWPMLAGSHFVH